MAEAATLVPNADREREFRNALGTFATGVVVVTTRDAHGEAHGLTVNSFTAVSLEPRLILWSQAIRAASVATFDTATHFAVNVLALDQLELARGFARPGVDKFAGVRVTAGLGGAPLLVGAAASFECLAREIHRAGDHLLRLGEVLRFQYSQQPPLIFAQGRYQRGHNLETHSNPDADLASAWDGLS
jgi:flavin reductase (DIM6/NTAB) family NADH-FMN oxidoreductase RutF